MATYSELKAQAEKLLLEAEEVRKAEALSVINDIKQKITQYGITARDLGFSLRSPSSRSEKRSSAESSGSVTRYRGPEGQAWSGMGRRPQWYKDGLAAGKSPSDFAA